MSQMMRATGVFSVDEMERIKQTIARANAVGYMANNWKLANFIRAAVNGALDRMEPKLLEMEKLQKDTGAMSSAGKLTL